MDAYANGACALKFPSNYVMMDSEEMEYVDGGFYISYNTIKAVVVTACLNPVGATLVGLGLAALTRYIVGGAAVLGAKIGSLGGPLVAAVSAVFSAVIGLGAASTIAHALIQRKGIGVDLVYSRWGVPYWVNINVR